MIKNCAWYLFYGESIFVQKLMGEWHYWDKDGWHILTEVIQNCMIYDEIKNAEYGREDL